MRRQCVFCGEEPDERNREHVIPAWLIRLTGDENRTASFGVDYRTGKQRKFAFDQFRFPSCRSCNEASSSLETRAKPAVLDLLRLAPLTRTQLHDILSWLDKVRIGLWLGFLKLDGNPLGIRPHFAINSRVSTQDRAFVVYVAEESSAGLSFMGANTPIFHLFPSCFLLRINNVALLNLSAHSLFCRRLGLPYASKIKMAPDARQVMAIPAVGLGRPRLPLLPIPYDRRGSLVAEPLSFRHFGPGYTAVETRSPITRDLQSMGATDVGIVVESRTGVHLVSDDATDGWVPAQRLDRQLFFDITHRMPLRLQVAISETLPDLSELDGDYREYFRRIYREARAVNDHLLRGYDARGFTPRGG